MGVELAVSIIGMITGGLSLVSVLWLYAYKMGRQDFMLKHLWKTVVEDGVYRQQKAGFITEGSPWHMTEKWKELSVSPVVLARLRDHFARHGVPDADADIATHLIEVLGWEYILQTAKKRDMPPSDLIARGVVLVREQGQQWRKT